MVHESRSRFPGRVFAIDEREMKGWERGIGREVLGDFEKEMVGKNLDLGKKTLEFMSVHGEETRM